MNIPDRKLFPGEVALYVDVCCSACDKRMALSNAIIMEHRYYCLACYPQNTIENAEKVKGEKGGITLSEKIKIEHLQDLKTRVTALMVVCDEYDLHQKMFALVGALDHAITKFSHRKIKETSR